MSFFNSLLISALLWPFYNEPTHPNLVDRCENFVVDHKFKHDQNGKYTLTITPKGGMAPYVVFVWPENEELLDYEGKATEYKNLKSGKYTCVIGDAAKCGKKLEITIE
jgi:hypothetical protein